MRTRLPLLALAAALVLPAHAATPIDETRALDPTGSIEIENLKGRIEVRTWDRAEVRVTGTLGDGVRRLRLDGGGRALKIEAEYPENSRGTGPTTLLVTVPQRAEVEIESVAAEVDVEGVAGASLDIESVSGNVVAVGAPRRADVESVSGNVRLSLNSATLDAETVSGNLSLRGRIGEQVKAETVSGNIDIDTRGERPHLVDASTVSGDVRIRTGLADGGKLAFESVSGDLELTMPASLSARARGETFSGTLRAPQATIDKADFGPGASFSHRYGQGSGEIEIETFSGDATLVLE